MENWWSGERETERTDIVGEALDGEVGLSGVYIRMVVLSCESLGA